MTVKHTCILISPSFGQYVLLFVTLPQIILNRKMTLKSLTSKSIVGFASLLAKINVQDLNKLKSEIDGLSESLRVTLIKMYYLNFNMTFEISTIIEEHLESTTCRLQPFVISSSASYQLEKYVKLVKRILNCI